MVKITKNGQTVSCYGSVEEDSNFSLVFDNEDFDGIWAGDGWDRDTPPKNWTEVVEHLTEYATRVGTELLEVSTC